ncbi:hypothetical protein PT974_01924 [Cladobotryum mycophilum]|uniref:BZIP domain-containing protein n=1 Tax=Cladobotryum mycophilum TaxID=491253 RepID=A0ABR0SXG3_9HYPO
MSLRSRGDGRPAPSIQSEISILNAEEYKGGPTYRPPKSQPLSNHAADTNGSAAGKRRAPVDREDDDGDDEVKAKRSRGRPRLDTKDETAADRRRTQIRLAQRAYRHRKDTAITTLEQKVKEKEQVSDVMAKEFSTFYNILLSEGILDLAPQVAPRLKSIADKIFRLANTSRASNGALSPDSDEPTSRSLDRTSHIGNSSDVGVSLSPANHDSQTGYGVEHGGNLASGFSSSLQNGHHSTNSLTYEVIAQATPENATFPFLSSMETIEGPPSQSQDLHLGQPLSNHSPYPRLPSPASYAFQERSFGRRLHRTTLERGLKLAMMPNPPADRFAATFGFCLLFETKESIIRRLVTGLKRSQNEGLSTWKLPLTSLDADDVAYLENQFGLSGLDSHGQNVLAFGKSSNMLDLSSATFGPQAQPDIDDKAEQRIRLITQNFEGEFILSNEVEQFLNKLGINIPPHADFVEAEIDIEDLRGAAEASSGSNTASSNSQFGGVGLGTSSPGFGISNMWSGNSSISGNFGASSLGGSSATNVMNIGHMLDRHADSGSGITSGIAAFMAQDFGQMWSSATNWNKTKVTIDVAKLIEEMVSKSVCLGKSPGLRAKDVVRAIKIAAGMISASA